MRLLFVQLMSLLFVRLVAVPFVQAVVRGEPRYHAIRGDNVQNVQVFDDRSDQRRERTWATLATGYVGVAGRKRDVLLEAKVFNARVSNAPSRRKRHSRLHFVLVIERSRKVGARRETVAVMNICYLL